MGEPESDAAWAGWLWDDTQARARDLPELAARKHARMLASPHGLFRGSAPLFYRLAQAHVPRLPFAARGVIVGDMHLENFGVYRVDGRGEEVVFDLNDFDDAGPGPLALDVLRLGTSVLLAGRSFGDPPARTLAWLEAALGRYGEVLRAARPAPPRVLPAPLVTLCERARRRTKRAALAARTERVGKGRRFERGPRYEELPQAIAREAQPLLEAWLEALGKRAPRHARSLRVVDAAQRIAGNGSLGVLRIALLTRDDEGELRMVELKEARAPAYEVRRTKARPSEAERVVTAARALLARPPRRLAALPPLRVDGRTIPLVGRALAPQEDKLSLEAETWQCAPMVLDTMFHLLGCAHRRAHGAPIEVPRAALSASIDAATMLAARFEGIALAYARGFATRAPAQAPSTSPAPGK